MCNQCFGFFKADNLFNTYYCFAWHLNVKLQSDAAKLLSIFWTAKESHHDFWVQQRCFLRGSFHWYLAFFNSDNLFYTYYCFAWNTNVKPQSDAATFQNIFCAAKESQHDFWVQQRGFATSSVHWFFGFFNSDNLFNTYFFFAWYANVKPAI